MAIHIYWRSHLLLLLVITTKLCLIADLLCIYSWCVYYCLMYMYISYYDLDCTKDRGSPRTSCPVLFPLLSAAVCLRIYRLSGVPPHYDCPFSFLIMLAIMGNTLFDLIWFDLKAIIQPILKFTWICNLNWPTFGRTDKVSYRVAFCN